MLIKVFGVWLALNNGYLQEGPWSSKTCTINFSNRAGYSTLDFENHTCDEVAEEINKQTKGAK